MNIGFGNGDFWRLNSFTNERFDEGFMKNFMMPGVNTLELHCINEETLDYILEYRLRFATNIKSVSLHAPTMKIKYDDSEKSHRVLRKIELVCAKYNIRNAVFHPDLVLDWDVLNDYTNIPVSIENMDDRKKIGRTIEDIEGVLRKYDFGLTLDLQRCFVNDKIMQLAQDFQNKFENRIVEYHVSGFQEDLLHYPLYKTRQDSIIKSLKYKNVPIIIESVFDRIGEQYRELEYIKQRLS